jgi:arylsulfatase A-like enzyme
MRLSRAQYALVLLLGTAGAIAFATGCNRNRELEPPPPACPGCNVILISMDTLRADHVGTYGYTLRETTPNIDRLATGSVLFENAISQSSWTRPAHMSIFTGRYPAEHGYKALRDRAPLPDNVPTLAGVLSDNGYQTAAFTGGINVAAAFGFDNGFETYRTNGKYFRDNLEDTKYWFEQEMQEPFFLFWHGYDAHTPYLTDPIDRAALELPDSPPRRGLRTFCQSEKGTARIRKYKAEYDGAIHRGDRYVGKLLKYLEERNLLDRTIIVFLSDHGEEFLEHGRCFHLSTLYREVLHVPLFFSGPGISPRRIPDTVPASVTIAPTIMDLIGVTEHPLPGASLAHFIAGGSAPVGLVVSETERSQEKGQGDGHLRSLTTVNAKYIHWTTKDEQAYFDSAQDLPEQHPVSEGKQVDDLAGTLGRWSELHQPLSGAAQTRSESGQKDEELESQLRALGYTD